MKKDLLNKLESFDLIEEFKTGSNKKLLLFVIDSLIKIGIDPTFPYLCVAANKMFPQIFSLDKEFPEFPNAIKVRSTLESLTDELMLTDSKSYRLSLKGKNIARDVSAKLILNIIRKPEQSQKQIGSNVISQNYSSLQLSKIYSTYLLDKRIDLEVIWNYFEISPNSHINELKKFFTELNTYANTIGDRTMNLFTKEVLRQLNENI